MKIRLSQVIQSGIIRPISHDKGTRVKRTVTAFFKLHSESRWIKDGNPAMVLPSEGQRVIASMKRWVLLLFVLSSAAAHSQESASIFMRGPSGEVFVSNCRAVEKLDLTTHMVPTAVASQVGQCLGYISGHLDTIKTLQAFGILSKDASCVPDAATVTQLAKVVVKYADSHPEELHLGALLLLNKSLESGFPCK